MKGAQRRTQPGLVRASGRKRHNRMLREEGFGIEAAARGISVQELKQEKFEAVQEIRKSPPRSGREIVH